MSWLQLDELITVDTLGRYGFHNFEVLKTARDNEFSTYWKCRRHVLGINNVKRNTSRVEWVYEIVCYFRSIFGKKKGKKKLIESKDFYYKMLYFFRPENHTKKEIYISEWEIHFPNSRTWKYLNYFQSHVFLWYCFAQLF
jgi:hypothetical protein